MTEAERLAQALEGKATAPWTREEVAAELRRLSADARMLDWIATAGTVLISLVVDAPHDGDICVSSDQATGYGKDLRAAIDQAMKDTP